MRRGRRAEVRFAACFGVFLTLIFAALLYVNQPIRLKQAAVVQFPTLQQNVTSSSSSLFRYTLHLTTEYGTMVWGLHDQEAPQSVRNIVRLVHDGFYNKSCIYRYEKGFVLQGGGCAGNASPHTVPLEYNLPNVKHSVALARSSDPHSGGSEWFINLRDNSRSLGPQHKGGYAVFAHVIEGFDVIAALKKRPTHKQGLTLFDRPQPKITAAWVKGEGRGIQRQDSQAAR